MTAEGAPPAAIESYHAHVYFDAGSREAAQTLRDAITEAFPVEMGRWPAERISLTDLSLTGHSRNLSKAISSIPCD